MSRRGIWREGWRAAHADPPLKPANPDAALPSWAKWFIEWFRNWFE